MLRGYTAFFLRVAWFLLCLWRFKFHPLGVNRPWIRWKRRHIFSRKREVRIIFCRFQAGCMRVMRDGIYFERENLKFERRRNFERERKIDDSGSKTKKVGRQQLKIASERKRWGRERRDAETKTRRGMIFDMGLYRMCFERCVSIIYCKIWSPIIDLSTKPTWADRDVCSLSKMKNWRATS